MFLLVGRGAHRCLILGLFNSQETAQEAAHRLRMSSDGYHELEIEELQVGDWGPELDGLGDPDQSRRDHAEFQAYRAPGMGPWPSNYLPDYRVRLPLPERSER